MTETMGNWRLLDLSYPQDPYLNMAIEEAALQAVGERQAPPTLRLWQNDNAVIIGYFQNAQEEANLPVCQELGTAVVRRVSGGGAVYHDAGNVNYALFVPQDDPCVSADVLESYRFFCQGIIDALDTLGLKAEFKPINDIVVDGRKVSGTAQARKHHAVLHHGTLLLKVNVEMMGKVLRVSQAYLKTKNVVDIKQRVATLAQLGRPTTIEEAKAALAAGYARLLGVRFQPGDLLPYERELAQRLCEQRYRNDDWNLKEPEEKREDKGHLVA
jgi:lipoate---protein ligase